MKLFFVYLPIYQYDIVSVLCVPQLRIIEVLLFDNYMVWYIRDTHLPNCPKLAEFITSGDAREYDCCQWALVAFKETFRAQILEVIHRNIASIPDDHWDSDLEADTTPLAIGFCPGCHTNTCE